MKIEEVIEILEDNSLTNFFKKDKMYKPLPKNLMIKGSDIQGQGLFATESISSETVLGVTHVESKNGSQNGYWRTPLGGFINHSDTPNCIKKENEFTKNLYLETLKDIDGGEELTVQYTLYKLNGKGTNN